MLFRSYFDDVPLLLLPLFASCCSPLVQDDDDGDEAEDTAKPSASGRAELSVDVLRRAAVSCSCSSTVNGEDRRRASSTATRNAKRGKRPAPLSSSSSSEDSSDDSSEDSSEDPSSQEDDPRLCLVRRLRPLVSEADGDESMCDGLRWLRKRVKCGRLSLSPSPHFCCSCSSSCGEGSEYDSNDDRATNVFASLLSSDGGDVCVAHSFEPSLGLYAVVISS